MARMDEIVSGIARSPGWTVLDRGDLDEFRRRCCGILTPASVVVGGSVRGAQMAILGEEHPTTARRLGT